MNAIVLLAIFVGVCEGISVNRISCDRIYA